MGNIKTIIDNFKRKNFTGGVSEACIENAEKQLGLSFALDYKELLMNYGSLLTKGEEFLGIDESCYDVVKATSEVRKLDINFPDDAYVIENMAIDGILLIQNSKGELYAYQPNKALQKAANCLSDYLESL